MIAKKQEEMLAKSETEKLLLYTGFCKVMANGNCNCKVIVTKWQYSMKVLCDISF